jgi:hypothetical protein
VKIYHIININSANAFRSVTTGKLAYGQLKGHHMPAGIRIMESFEGGIHGSDIMQSLLLT